MLPLRFRLLCFLLLWFNAEGIMPSLVIWRKKSTTIKLHVIFYAIFWQKYTGYLFFMQFLLLKCMKVILILHLFSLYIYFEDESFLDVEYFLRIFDRKDRIILPVFSLSTFSQGTSCFFETCALIVASYFLW